MYNVLYDNYYVACTLLTIQMSRCASEFSQQQYQKILRSNACQRDIRDSELHVSSVSRQLFHLKK